MDREGQSDWLWAGCFVLLYCVRGLVGDLPGGEYGGLDESGLNTGGAVVLLGNTKKTGVAGKNVGRY